MAESNGGAGTVLRGSATTFGAITIVNAIAGGKGATASVKLKTEVSAEILDKPGRWVTKINGKETDSSLSTEVVRSVLKSAGKDIAEFSGTIETASEIPIGVGLKSSSSSSTAIALAVSAAMGQRAFDPLKILNCSVEASLASGVSVTGAFDDASSCLLGGMNFTDNIGRKMVRSRLFDKSMKVVIKVPKGVGSRRSSAADPQFMKKFAKLTEVFFEMCLRGDYWRAMTLNGTTYSGLMRYDPFPALRAVELGALGAGLSGTGPAIAAVFDPSKPEMIKALAQDWAADGSTVLETETNNVHGRLVAEVGGIPQR